ncbi:hypothetical protein JD79_02636 [Geodermatophilus normandii]|uniref:Uncharacterized protein n=1 Tax=Geodermatophilus normandii TaxID=1137989 RepID=A0A317QJG2_9ACTN|nr:hypothetical protein [Geodermatophilus normandii]PWW23462.1 hypothetical protein JD79_02636 [Geodermatophilus normandii]
MTTPAVADVPVRSPLALTRRWASLLQPLVFDARSLRLSWIGPDGRQSPVLLPIGDLPDRPDLRLVSGLLGGRVEPLVEAQVLLGEVARSTGGPR